jgi:transposase-like protein
MRWVLRYVPEYECRWARFARSPGSSWRMDETAVSVRGGRHYLYRAVDRNGKSVASLLCTDRSMEPAQAFFRAAVSQEAVPWPEKINVDGNSATHRGRPSSLAWTAAEVRTAFRCNAGKNFSSWRFAAAKPGPHFPADPSRLTDTPAEPAGEVPTA